MAILDWLADDMWSEPNRRRVTLGNQSPSAAKLGVTAQDAYAAGLVGALCDEQTRTGLIERAAGSPPG
jgi:hypothetical protein